jgi:hypothetical protein
MPLEITTGKLDLLPTSIVCQLTDGTRMIACTVEHQALRDLADYHLREALPDVAAFGELLQEIERLANAKFYTGRVEQSGDLVIASADVLLYGFEARWAKAAE